MQIAFGNQPALFSRQRIPVKTPPFVTGADSFIRFGSKAEVSAPLRDIFLKHLSEAEKQSGKPSDATLELIIRECNAYFLSQLSAEEKASGILREDPARAERLLAGWVLRKPGQKLSPLEDLMLSFGCWITMRYMLILSDEMDMVEKQEAFLAMQGRARLH